ncbi:MAG: PBP1A family penicillin-binding protein [Candidatus Gastranaerophilales bacterium]|nr:PBP1A family penicillin-binding protein [Candidatus Gastranaerophilales bacterium]
MSKKKKNVFLTVIFTLIKVGIITGLACTLAGYTAVKMYLNDLEPIPNLENYTRNIVTQVLSSDERIIKTFQAYNYEHVSIDEVPKYLKDALISTEDKNFYTHEGYDILGICRSVIVNIVNKKASQGASTITQQLARVLFLSNEKTITRKLKEIQIAARIEKSISKDKILEMYLNNVYLGSGAYGVGAAASTYFNKPLANLTLAECALIAGLPQAPSVYSPYRNKKLAEKRRNKVLKRMYIMKTIDKKQYDSALKEPITLNRKPSTVQSNIAPYFIDYVLKELEELGYDENEITQGGYKITTTLDYDAQVAANESIAKNLAAWKLTKSKQNAALFTFSPMNGAIIAYCGGKDYATSQYDRITQAVRPPGSAFKPIVYTTAVHKGWMPIDMIEDSPVTIGDWTPRNYGDKYRGMLPLYRALAISSNVIAVKLIENTGIAPVIDMARALGITTPLTHDYTIALGSNGAKLYDMVVVYGNFANGGYKVKPYAIEKIETERGKVIYQAERTKITKVLDTDTAAIMTAMLRRVITEGTGRGANIGKPMGGKTGTINENKDAWFIGYTPDLVTGVFVGNDDNTSTGLTGGTLPARIWKDMMAVATKKYGSPEFNYPPVDMEVVYEETVIDLSEDLKALNKENKFIDTIKAIPAQITSPLDIFRRKTKEIEDKKAAEEQAEMLENTQSETQVEKQVETKVQEKIQINDVIKEAKQNVVAEKTEEKASE